MSAAVLSGIEQWRAGRRQLATLGDEAVGYETEAGWAYEAGFIVDHTGNPDQTDAGPCGYYVPLPSVDCAFATLEEAEQFLWAEWCGPEINEAEAQS